MNTPRIVCAATLILNEHGNVIKWFGRDYKTIFQEITQAGYYHSYQKWHSDGYMLDYGTGREMFLNEENTLNLARELGVSIEELCT